MTNSILILGKPNSGKTRFLTQLIYRVEKCKSKVKRSLSAKDSSLIMEDLMQLLQGKAAARTATQTMEKMEMEVLIKDEKVAIAYPDAAGEQTLKIVEERQINLQWKEAIESSNAWMLFIRPSQLNRPHLLTEKPVQVGNQCSDRKFLGEVSDQVFYIELLQIICFFKQIGHRNFPGIPRLTIALTCWDELDLSEDTCPEPYFQKQLPLLYQYLTTIWRREALQIVGLSAQGRELGKESNDEFIDAGPENQGYMVLPNGEREQDVTQIIEDLFS